MERKLRYLETEIQKEKDIPLVEPQEFCEAPKPKEMIDLEVCYFSFNALYWTNEYLIDLLF